MCSLCGILAGRGHWADSSTNPEVFAGREQTHTFRRERQDRLRLINPVLKYFGLTLGDWAASSYVLRSHTGRTVLVENLSALWAAAEELSGRPCDPLDPLLLDALTRDKT